MRTPEEIDADLKLIESGYQENKALLLKELAEAKMGFTVGDTITNGKQSLRVGHIGARFISGVLRHTDYELRVDQLEGWSKADIKV